MDAIFAAFLGDARKRPPRRRETGGVIGGGETVRLLADDEKRRAAIAPEAELEGQPEDDADHGIDHLARKFRELQDGHALAVGVDREQLPEHGRHRVAADIGVLKHEAVARVVADGFDPRHQPVVDHAGGAVFQLAHAVVDQRHEIVDHVGRRRIDGEARALARIAASERHALDAALDVGIARLGQRNDLGQDVELLHHRRTAAIDRVGEFLEIEQPEGQLERRGIDDGRMRAEARAIFVVNVEQQHTDVGLGGHQLVEDDGRSGGLADAGGAEHGEMFRDQPVGIDQRRDAALLLHVADLHRPALEGGIDQLQMLAAEQFDGVADRRIFAHAAIEAKHPARPVADLAHQVDMGDRVAARRRGTARRRGNLADHADRGALGMLERDEFADRRAGTMERRALHQRHMSLRPPAGNDTAEFAAAQGISSGESPGFVLHQMPPERISRRIAASR